MSMKRPEHDAVVPPRATEVQQNFGSSQDINNMMSKYLRQPAHLRGSIGNPNATRKPMFGDFTNIDYHGMLNTVTQIDQLFAQFPARVRNRFKNRPELLLAFAANPDNVRESVKMGLIVDPEIVAAVQAAERQEAQQLDLEEQARQSGEPAKADPEANPIPPKKGVK